MANAWLTFLPLIISMTRRAFWADPRRYFALALASIIIEWCIKRKWKKPSAQLRPVETNPFTIYHSPFTALCRRRCRRWSGHLRRLFGFLGLGSGMAFEHSRRRKLTQFVPDHVLRNVNRNMALAVVHAKRQSHHVRRNGRTSRPGANHLRSLRAGAYALDCLPNTFVHPGTFFN